MITLLVLSKIPIGAIVFLLFGLAFTTFIISDLVNSRNGKSKEKRW